MTTYETLPDPIEKLLWSYAKALHVPPELNEPLREEEEEQTKREEKLYKFLSRRREMVRDLTTLIREHVDKQSQKFVPSAILLSGDFIPWYKFSSDLIELTQVKEMKNVIHTPVEIPLIGAIQRLSAIGIHLTEEQMVLVEGSKPSSLAR